MTATLTTPRSVVTRATLAWYGWLSAFATSVALLGLIALPAAANMRPSTSLVWILYGVLGTMALMLCSGLVHWIRRGGETQIVEASTLGSSAVSWTRRNAVGWMEIASGVALIAIVGLMAGVISGVAAALLLALLLNVVLVPVRPRPVLTPNAILRLDPNFDTEDGLVGKEWSWTDPTGKQSCWVGLRIRSSVVADREGANPSIKPLRGRLDKRTMDPKEWRDAAERLVLEGTRDVELRDAARQLAAHARKYQLSTYQEITNALRLAQAIPYTPDEYQLPDGSTLNDYWRYPIETLHDNAGDCDCKAILASALLSAMGWRTIVLLSAEEEHAAIAVEGAPDFPNHRYFVHDGRNYFFCETTATPGSLDPGQVPVGCDVTKYTVRVVIESQLRVPDVR